MQQLGNYTFSFIATDDYAALFIDGVQQLIANGSATVSIVVSGLSSGLHDIDVRLSDNTGGETLNLRIQDLITKRDGCYP